VACRVDNLRKTFQRNGGVSCAQKSCRKDRPSRCCRCDGFIGFAHFSCGTGASGHGDLPGEIRGGASRQGERKQENEQRTLPDGLRRDTGPVSRLDLRKSSLELHAGHSRRLHEGHGAAPEPGLRGGLRRQGKGCRGSGQKRPGNPFLLEGCRSERQSPRQGRDRHGRLLPGDASPGERGHQGRPRENLRGRRGGGPKGALLEDPPRGPRRNGRCCSVWWRRCEK